MSKRTILFIPVSSAQGVGEYMRCRIIADALQRETDDVDIQFVLSKQAPYLDTVPYTVHEVEQSPTRETEAVNGILSSVRPDVTVFDCSGRAAQFRHASRIGSRVVFVSQHRRKRNRGFSLQRIRYIDQHWIVQLKFVDGGLGCYERIKQKLLGNNEPMFIGAVYDDSQLNRIPLSVQSPYIVYSAGGGGYNLAGSSAAEIFGEVAAAVKLKTGANGVLVLGANYQGDAEDYEGVVCVNALDNREMMALVSQAELVVSGGGDLMSQAVSMHKPVIAVAVAKDQASRIKAFVCRGLVMSSTGDSESMIDVVEALLGDEAGKAKLQAGISAEGISNGLHQAVRSLLSLIDKSEQERCMSDS